MAIEFSCHVCGKVLRTSEEKAGRTAKCPGCGESLTVPASETDADEFGSDEDGAGDSEYDDAPSSSRSMTSRSRATEPCPMCGEEISASATRCRFCGEEIDGGYSPRRDSYQQAHRGAMILTFGILSFFVCPIFGIVAWVLANSDLQEMQAGRMDPEGEGLTKAGKIISIISISLNVAVIVLYCAFFIFIMAVGAAA